MFQGLFLTVCMLLTVTALNGVKLHKKYNLARDDIPSECDDGRVKCQNSDRCIPQRWVCDGDNDCGDYSDESDCPPVTCSNGKTRCPTVNRCVPTVSICNGVNDCGDNSDEPEDCRSRTCSEGQLKCKSGQCIDFDAYCAGSDSCADNTYFTDITCPPFTCDPGYVKCAVKSVCKPISYVCDGDNDCGDMTDEPENCRDRSCESGFFKCNNGQCLNRTSICLSIESYRCRDDTDTSSLCTDFTCPAGYTKCVSNGMCTADRNLCDGTQDCADGSDEAPEYCTTPMQCTDPDTASCPGKRRCINTRYFCDTDNDCGDNSDEEALFCSTRTCQPNEVRCSNGQCLDKNSFCVGTHSCRDGSLRDMITICVGDASPESTSSADTLMPSVEEMTCLMALMSLDQTCAETPFPDLKIHPSNEGAILDKLGEMDFNDICRPIRTWFECYKNTLSVCADVDNPMLTDIKRMISIGENAINYVCVQHVEVFNRNKACLLEKNESGPGRYTSEPKLYRALSACERNAERMDNPFCITDQLQGCIKDAVAAQCGDEVSSALSGLVDLVQSAAGCPTSRLRALSQSLEERRAVRQLRSGNEEELKCMSAIFSMEQNCVAYSLKDSDPKAIYRQLVASDIGYVCGIAREMYGCVEREFRSCANVNNPLVADLKQVLPVISVALSYVCDEHANVINRNKACLLREASTGSPGPYPVPEIAEALMPCTQLIQPGSDGNGGPLCINSPAAETCANNAIAAQCGREIANTVSGLTDVIRSAANCPARRMVDMRSLKAALKKRRDYFYKKA